MNANHRKIVIVGGGILLAVSVTLNLMMLGQLGELRSRVLNLGNAANQLDASFKQLDQQIDSLSQQLSESSSLLAQSRVDVQLEGTSQLVVSVSVSPRELRPGDVVTVSVLDTSMEATEEDGSFTARLHLPVFAGDITPVVTIESADGTRRMETLASFSTAGYFQLYYSFDFTTNSDGTSANVGLLPAGDCVLTLPDDLEHVWLNISNQSSSQLIEMTLDGKRIPDASGLPGSSPEPDLTTSSGSAGGLYYIYYTAKLPAIDDEQSYDLSAEIETTSGLVYQLDIDELDASIANGNSSYGGGGNLSPLMTDEQPS